LFFKSKDIDAWVMAFRMLQYARKHCRAVLQSHRDCI